jgi:ATP-dependent DNA helicase RecQ
MGGKGSIRGLVSSQPERMAWLAQVVPGLEGSGVIYVLTIADTTRVASFLRT